MRDDPGLDLLPLVPDEAAPDLLTPERRDHAGRSPARPPWRARLWASIAASKPASSSEIPRSASTSLVTSTGKP